jgi:hypothetical protein
MAKTNFDALLVALEPYSITLQGQDYVAREISYLEAKQLKQQMEQMQDDDEAVVRAFCDALQLPTDLIVQLPTVLVETMIRDFFAWSRTRNPTPSGSTSS